MFGIGQVAFNSGWMGINDPLMSRQLEGLMNGINDTNKITATRSRWIAGGIILGIVSSVLVSRYL